MPEHVRAVARDAPDHWIGVVDPAWTDAAAPPPWAVTGEWRSAPDGEVVEWRPNDDYRPSPLALEWPEPTDPVDAAVQLAVTGYGPLSDVVEALAGAEVAVLRAPDGGPLTVAGADGSPTVPLFTSVPHQSFEGVLAHDTVVVADLVSGLATDRVHLSVNPAGPAHLRLEARLIRDALPPTAPSRPLPTSPVIQRTP
ncbi:type VII secretion system-associated protein [Streptomyces sp. NPDC092952]|uniref:type VII secretion system-associated protein n=1 Tax=Streptomyces sp. NPDC092952 TaxID=3366018 RepID=UPI0037FE3A26